MSINTQLLLNLQYNIYHIYQAMATTLSAWESFKSIKTRSLFKNKYLTGQGLTKPQIIEIMRKMKVYIDRIEQSTLGMRVKKQRIYRVLLLSLMKYLITNGKSISRIIIRMFLPTFKIIATSSCLCRNILKRIMLIL